MYTGIPVSCVVGLTGTTYGSRTGTCWVSGDPNLVFPIGIFGKGYEQIYLLSRLPRQPRRALGNSTFSNNLGGYFCVYTVDVLPSDAFRQNNCVGIF